MESKKDIGNYFKENLEQLDYSPSDKVWDGIELELKEKKKKRRFIFWMFFAAITIGVLSMYTYYSGFNSGKPNTESVVTTEGNNIDSNKINETKIGGNKFGNNENNKTGENNVDDGADSDINKNSSKTSSGNNNTKTNSKSSVGNAVNNKKLKTNFSKKDKIVNYKKRNKARKNDSSILAKKIIEKKSKKRKKSKKSTDNNTNFDSLKALKTNSKLTTEANKNYDLNDLKGDDQEKTDSLLAIKKAEKEKKKLDKKPKEEDSDSIKVEVVDKRHEIIIAPYYGYNYNGNLGNGNFLNDNKTSKKSSQFKESYGVVIRLMGSNKIGTQIGVGIINASYSATFEKTNNNFISPNSVSFDIPLNEINNMFPNQKKVTATHETTYIEVPIEGYYIFSNKKFGYATSFGISLLKLQNDELFFESDTVDRIKIGKLNSTSPFCFSANVKLNLYYKISSKLQFDIYPSFQYLIMGFKDVSNYHPYFFSIKTGLSYKL